MVSRKERDRLSLGKDPDRWVVMADSGQGREIIGMWETVGMALSQALEYNKGKYKPQRATIHAWQTGCCEHTIRSSSAMLHMMLVSIAQEDVDQLLNTLMKNSEYRPLGSPAD